MSPKAFSVRLKIARYLGIALFVAITEIPIEALLLFVFLAIGVNIQQSILLSIPISAPITIAYVVGAKEPKNYFDLLFFKLMIIPILTRVTSKLSNSLNNGNLESCLSYFAELENLLTEASKIYVTSDMDRELGFRVYEFLSYTFVNLEPDKLRNVEFRKPIIVKSPDPKIELPQYLVKEHKFLKKLSPDEESYLRWIWQVHCLDSYINFKDKFPSPEFVSSINYLLYLMAQKQASLFEYNNSETKTEFDGLTTSVLLYIFYLLSKEGKDLISLEYNRLRKDFLGWLAAIDLAVRGTTIKAFTNATQYFYDKLAGEAQSIESLTKELSEDIVSGKIGKYQIISGLKAFAKIAISLSDKKRFVELLGSELSTKSLAPKEYKELINNILNYISIFESVTKIANGKSNATRFQITVEATLVSNLVSNTPARCNIVFKDENEKLLDAIEETPLLFDRNTLSKHGTLDKIEYLTEHGLSLINVGLPNNHYIGLLAWPFGVTSNETTFMGIWPPTIDSILFSNILGITNYFSKSTKVIDIGAGSGIIGLSVLSINKNNKVTFTDLNRDAEIWLKANIKMNNLPETNVSFITCHSLDCFNNDSNCCHFDYALLSPPYLPLFLLRESVMSNDSEENRFTVIFEEYSIETMDTGLLYDVILNFKTISEKLIVLYSSIADDVVSSAIDSVKKKGINLSVNTIYENLIPLKIKGIIPTSYSELDQWKNEKPDKLNRVIELLKRGRLFDPPTNEEKSYPFWQKIKVIEIF